MLLRWFPKLEQNKFVIFLNNFYKSIYYLLLVGLFIALSSLLGLEIPIYAAIALIAGIIPALFCDDMLSTMAPLMMFYCTFSLKNNNSNINKSAFSDPSFLIPLIVIASVIALFLGTRLVFDLVTKKERRIRPRLLIGMIILSVLFLISGIFSPYFEAKSVLIGGLQIVGFFATYLYLLYSVDWKKFKTDYAVNALIIFGIAIFVEIFVSYFICKDNKFFEWRGKICIGWGRRTNMGGMAAMFVVAPLYFVAKNKKPIFNTLISILLLISVFMSQSRNPLLTASIVYLIGFIIAIIKANKMTRICALITLGFTLFFAGRLINIYWDDFKGIFENFFVKLFETDFTQEQAELRINLIKDGIAKFLEYPIFGTGWTSCTGEKFTMAFFPARWHNTIVQTLATGGIFLTLAYLYHRFETIWLLFRSNKRVPLNKFYLYLPIVALIISSMLDCFMFNIGPGLLVGALLAIIEKGEDDSITLFKGRKKQLVCESN